MLEEVHDLVKEMIGFVINNAEETLAASNNARNNSSAYEHFTCTETNSKMKNASSS